MTYHVLSCENMSAQSISKWARQNSIFLVTFFVLGLLPAIPKRWAGVSELSRTWSKYRGQVVPTTPVQEKSHRIPSRGHHGAALEHFRGCSDDLHAVQDNVGFWWHFELPRTKAISSELRGLVKLWRPDLTTKMYLLKWYKNDFWLSTSNLLIWAHEHKIPYYFIVLEIWN